MSATLVQSGGNRVTATTTTAAVTLGSATTTGNLLVVAATGYVNNGTYPPAYPVVTDNKGNVYRLVSRLFSGSLFGAIYVSANAAGGASHQITATVANGGYVTIGAGEFGGVGSVVVSRGFSVAQDSSGSASSGGAPIVAASDLLIGLYHDDSWVRTITPAGGLSTIYQATGNASFAPMSLVYATGLTVDTAATWTASGSSSWFAQAVTLAAAGASIPRINTAAGRVQ